MAKKKPEDFTDVPEIEPAGAGFVDNPMPPQHIIEQEAAPVGVEPEAMGRPSSRRKRNTPEAQAMPRQGIRPIKEIVDAFLAEINGHPDCMILAAALGGKPPQAVFQETPMMNKHQVDIKFAWRDAQPETSYRVDENAKPAYAPGGKYWKLIHGNEDIAEPTREGTPAWNNLVKQREEVTV